MNRGMKSIFSMLILNVVLCSAKNCSSQHMYIVCTSALIEYQKNIRQQEYCNGIKAIKSFGYNPYVIESIAQGPTYLDKLTDRVMYTKTNNSLLKNKGVNEAMALMSFINKCGFDDNDIVVKITGRYILQSDKFLRLIEENIACDAFVKRDLYGQVFTGCFALKFKFLKEFLYSLDLHYMEEHMVNIEQELACFLLQRQDIKVCEVSSLDLLARIGRDPIVKI